MKKLLTFAMVFAAGALVAAGSVHAQTTSTSTPSILKDAQTAIDNLISAKDTGNANDVSLRIAALEQVIALQTSETKDYELKLINSNGDKAYDAWKAKTLDSLSKFLDYYDSESRALNTSTVLTSENVKQIAVDFKTWRDETYLPLINQAQDFLLVQQEADAVQVAQARYKKIVQDLGTIGSPVVSASDSIKSDLKDATSSIAAADALNKQAAALFLATYVNATSTKDNAAASSTSPTSSSTASSSAVLNVTPLDLTATSSLDDSSSTAGTAIATSTDASATSTAPTGEATSTPAVSSQPISIKGLVKASLDKIRGAYQDFIDISNLVRQLLD